MATNMDLSRKSNPDGPQLEFTLPLNEIDEKLDVGQVGFVTIPVEVTQLTKDSVSFRKRGKARVPSSFSQPSLKDMEDEIGIAER